MKRSVAIASILIMGVLWAGVDLGTKRWVQLHLATPVHLLPVTAVDGKTICEAYKTKLGIQDCRQLDNRVYQVEGPLKLKKDDVLKDILVDHPLLFAFPQDKGYAVRIRIWQDKKKAPITTIGQALELSLQQSDQAMQKMLKTGIFGIPRGKGAIATGQELKKGVVYLLSSRRIVLIPGFLDFSYVENPAGAWGILRSVDPSSRKWIFYVFTIVAMLVILYLVFFPPSYSWWVLFALGGILGGAIGNLEGRFSRGAVVDFIHMFWGKFNWPNYNVADIGITVGLVILLIHSFFVKPKKPGKS